MKFHEWRERDEHGLDEALERLAAECVDAAIEVHRHLGPGLPEKAYREALSHELALRRIPHQCEAPVTIFFKGKLVGEGRVDILVAERLVLELKSVEELVPRDRSQTKTYLCALDLELGFLINFNVELLKDGLKRVIRSKRHNT